MHDKKFPWLRWANHTRDYPPVPSGVRGEGVGQECLVSGLTDSRTR